MRLPRNRRLAGWAAALWAAGASGQAQTAIVSDLHTVSVHVDGIETYNALLDLMAKDLRWPLLYGRRLGADRAGRRNYASFRVGNANLEICGPYPEEFVSGGPGARLHGLTFRPAVPSADSIRLLDASGIRHRPPFTSPSGKPEDALTFVVLEDEDLTGEALAISLMEVQNRSAEDEQHRAASAALAAGGGGPLGAVRVRDVEVALRGSRAKWQALLQPTGTARASGGRPAVRLVESDRREIAAVVVEVRSLERAVRFLKDGRMLGETADGRVAIAEARSLGMRVVLAETGAAKP